MGITERKEKEKLEIRKSILDASIKLFMEEGFDQVTMRKIAELIEYSPTTVYLYFKDKNEILYALHEQGFQKLAELNTNLLTIANPLVRLHKMGENYIDFGLENPEYYDLMFIQQAPMIVLNEMENCDWTYGEGALNALKATIQDCIDHGFIQDGNLEVIAMAIWGMVHGLVSLAIRGRYQKLIENSDLKQRMHESLHWLVSAIDRSIKK